MCFWSLADVNRVHTVMKNLEKSWNFEKIVISRAGKILKKIKVLEKS